MSAGLLKSCFRKTYLIPLCALENMNELMRAKLASGLFCLFLLEVVLQAAAESFAQNQDEAAIREVQTRQQDAWIGLLSQP
jgi:hypothetical protein